MDWLEFGLELLRIVISWPLAAVIVAVIFRDALSGLIARVKSLTVPGVQIEAAQRPEIPAQGNVEIKPPPPPQLPATLTPDQENQLKQLFQAQHAAARLWEYRYLNLFLARATQDVLDWLVNLGQITTADAFDAYWLPLIPDAKQRNLIVGVLQAHHLIELNGPVITVTDKAREYVNWRGTLPPRALQAQPG